MSAVATAVDREQELVARAKDAPSPALWAEYDRLRAKMLADAITPAEHAEMMRVYYQIENIHVARLTAVFELAALRGRSHEELMAEYGVVPRQTGDE